MNPPTHNAFIPPAGPGPGEAENTLRLIASLPVPEGLEDRLKDGLRAAPRTGRVLQWPAALRPNQGWLQSKVARGAAAAAIVIVVAGGGWGMYSRVQPVQAPEAIAMPHVAAPGGFSSAGAMRTPQTLKGPVLAHPVTASPKQPAPAARDKDKAPQKPAHHGKVAVDARQAMHESVPEAK